MLPSAAFHLHPGQGNVGLRFHAHGGIQIDPDHTATGAHLPRGDDGIQPRPTTEIEHCLTRLQVAALVGIPDPCKGRNRTGRRSIEPICLVAKELRGLPAVEEVKGALWLVGDCLVHTEDFVFEDGLQRRLCVGNSSHRDLLAKIRSNPTIAVDLISSVASAG
jgi:hypothetical protein